MGGEDDGGAVGERGHVGKGSERDEVLWCCQRFARGGLLEGESCTRDFAARRVLICGDRRKNQKTQN